MTKYLKWAGLGLLGLILLAAVSAWILGFNPLKAIRKEQGKDATAAVKIQAKGDAATTDAAQTHNNTAAKAEKEVNDATPAIRASPSSRTALASDSLARLRAADRKLCELGPVCSSARGGAEPGGPAPAPTSGGSG